MSTILLTNKTAFPLNASVNLFRVPAAHLNGLEPGESWTAKRPAFLPATLCGATVEVRYDHEHNRFSPEQSLRILVRMAGAWGTLAGAGVALVWWCWRVLVPMNSTSGWTIGGARSIAALLFAGTLLGLCYTSTLFALPSLDH